MLRRIAPRACFVADDYFGNTKEKHLGFPNVYKYNMVQTVKQAVQNHVTPLLPSLFGSNAFTAYSAFIRHLKLPARSSGPSATVFSSAPLLLLRAGLGTTAARAGRVLRLRLCHNPLIGAQGLLRHPESPGCPKAPWLICQICVLGAETASSSLLCPLQKVCPPKVCPP